MAIWGLNWLYSRLILSLRYNLSYISKLNLFLLVWGLSKHPAINESRHNCHRQNDTNKGDNHLIFEY